MVEPEQGKNEQDTSGAGEDTTLTLAAFEALLDTHGAKLDRWPDDVRAAALALVASDKQAERALRYAAGIESLLSASPAPKPAASLLQSIMDKTKS